jgi:hypothetical protein
LSIDCPAAVPQNIRSKDMNMMDLRIILLSPH